MNGEFQSLIKEISWAVLQRLEFIEIKLYWEGAINRSDISSFFKVSIPQSSSDIQKYKEIASTNIIYDGKEKKYFASECFNPVIYNPTPESILTKVSMYIEKFIETIPFSSQIVDFHDVTPFLERKVNLSIFKDVFDAIRKQRGIKIRYQSLKDELPITRTVAPVKIIFSGTVWYYRAFCGLRNEYRNFLFPRTLEIIQYEPRPIEFNKDEEWEQYIYLTIVPHKDLSSTQRSVVAEDFNMQNGKLVIKLRKPHLYHFKRKYNFDIQDTIPPERQQVLLIEEKEL